ncbi:pilus assembly PilX family protein [Acinetobacter nectaris]|uniref:pilus assembly PilX family protein n=1 Tax=Acinetobacter nectaris TaxID=1219382 RepID=UPI001F1A3004|nr:pilus assembly protein PilX [Acinetobacter nectaris]MCF8999577.1 pilus assembly protein PilX [Acinetobacter nectaris]MCF9027185.1 pilus assembly protein PilX [Acinetobacter nectaris]
MNRSLQQGATLIIVLCIVLLVTIIAAVAIRQSFISLNIATNAQAQKLMMQSSDAALLRFEQLHTQDNSVAVNSLFSTVKKNIGGEVVWCYSDLQRDFFIFNKYSVIRWTPGDAQPSVVTGKSGFCKSDSFSTGRSVVVTQVSATISSTNSSVVINNSSNDNSVPPVKIRVYTTSFIPTLSTAKPEDINDCLSKNMSAIPTSIPVNQTQTVSQCLTALNVPNYTAVAEYQDAN